MATDTKPDLQHDAHVKAEKARWQACLKTSRKAPRLCPVCCDADCETKSFRCGE
jgi:hypothetical protein